MPCYKDGLRDVWDEHRPMSGIKQSLKMLHTQSPWAVKLRSPIRERKAVVACKAESPERAVSKKMTESPTEDGPIGLGSEPLDVRSFNIFVLRFYEKKWLRGREL